VTELEQRIVAVIVALGEGEVVSYGDVAHDAGYPGRARAVGALLAQHGDDLPWWRVVRGDGRLVAPGAAAQAAALRAEGVTVRVGRVVHAPRGRFSRRQPSVRPARPARPARSARPPAT
jgi:methylated-DNA-protein-cysteine methyltransferase-like protein